MRPNRPDNLGRFPLESWIEAATPTGYAGTGFWPGDLVVRPERCLDYAAETEQQLVD